MMSRRAVVCGHTSGLGQALTEQLLAADYEVLGVARSSTGPATPKLIELGADLARPDQPLIVAEYIREHFGDFDVFVYSTGVLTSHRIDKIEPDDLESLYRVNVLAPMLLESRLLDLVKHNEAYIVNITSSSIVEYYADLVEYSSAKAAFAKFTEDVRRSLVDTNARVTEVCPSGFTSNIYRTMTGDPIPRDETKQIPASDVAALIMHLLNTPKIMEVGRVYINRKR